jgi:plasmid stabilization system protein ParE
MKEYTVVFTPEAEDQLAELYHYIAGQASADSALRYTTAIVEYCAAMKTFDCDQRLSRLHEPLAQACIVSLWRPEE